ncbi:MAG TPA: SgcJ/EcaC family oxidoreductase [Acidobacteriaceae bacterium]
MNRIATLCAATAVALTLIACNSTPTPAPNTHDADVKAIQDYETQWVQDWASKDAAKIMAHYADDAVLMVPGGPATSGKDAIQKSLAGMLADPALSLKFQSSRVDVASSGDLGYSQGSYTLTVTDPKTKKPINDRGSYVTTYRKQADGSWKAVADIATSEVPPGPPASAKAKKH